MNYTLIFDDSHSDFYQSINIYSLDSILDPFIPIYVKFLQFLF